MTPRWLLEAGRVDEAVYNAVTQTPTPSLDGECDGSPGRPTTRGCGSAARRFSPRRAVRQAAAPPSEASRPSRVASAAANLLLKPLSRRRRPDPSEMLASRRARMPESSSFPSGHSASAFAFATGVGSVLPVEAIPIRALASLVAYSRVHTGVHYPADVLAGAFLGTTLAQLACRTFARH